MKELPSESISGHDAAIPIKIPARGWWQIAKRVKAQLAADQIQIVSAGIAFYLFLSLFPILAATVATYGLITDPSEAETQIGGLKDFLPTDVFKVVGEMIRAIASEASSTLGWSVIFSILLSIWGANKGTKAMVKGLNIAYNETEKRGFFHLNLITLGLTLGIFVVGLVMITLVAGVPLVAGNVDMPPTLASAMKVIRWPILAVMVTGVLGVLYRWAPSRDAPKWSWVSPGSLVSALLWLAGSALFSAYIDNFGSMSKTYGPFAAVVTLMLWLFVTAYIVLLGAEIKSESELQTKRDSTKGPSEPMGSRGAYVADHVTGEKDGEDSHNSAGFS